MCPRELDPQLVAAARKELQLDSDMEQIAAYAPGDYQKYQEERRILADFVDSAEFEQSERGRPGVGRVAQGAAADR